jgi:hypothetical protein
MCNSCDDLYINGVHCHETGCQDSWKDTPTECLWCGNEFTPEEKYQEFCSESCSQDYHG